MNKSDKSLELLWPLFFGIRGTLAAEFGRPRSREAYLADVPPHIRPTYSAR